MAGVSGVGTLGDIEVVGVLMKWSIRLVAGVDMDGTGFAVEVEAMVVLDEKGRTKSGDKSRGGVNVGGTNVGGTEDKLIRPQELDESDSGRDDDDEPRQGKDEEIKAAKDEDETEMGEKEMENEGEVNDGSVALSCPEGKESTGTTFGTGGITRFD